MPDIEILRGLKLHKDPNDGLRISAEVGCMTSLNFFKSMDATDIGMVIRKAARHGHIEIMKQWKDVFEKECCADDFENAATYASCYGHIEIIKLFSEWGVIDDFHNVMDTAANEGHIDIVMLCKDLGADDFEWSYENASANGHYDIVKLLIEWDDGRYVDIGMAHAAEEGHTDIVGLCRDNGATDFVRAILYAIRNGHVEIVRLFKEWDVMDDFEDALAEAARYGHIEIVKRIRLLRTQLT